MADDDTDRPQTLVGLSFDTTFRAQEFLLAANGLAAAGRLRLVDAVTLVKDDAGKVWVHETTDPGPGRSAATGAMWASLLGLVLGGPVGWAAGLAVGAGAGAIRAKVVDIGIPDEWVDWFRQAVQPGTATVALLVEDLDRDALVEEAGRFTGADLLYANLEPATLARLRTALEDDGHDRWNDDDGDDSDDPGIGDEIRVPAGREPEPAPLTPILPPATGDVLPPPAIP